LFRFGKEEDTMSSAAVMAKGTKAGEKAALNATIRSRENEAQYRLRPRKVRIKALRTEE
jgi:hypothetical protein